MNRLLITLAIAASLTACGFHPRNALSLPADTPAVAVSSTAPYSKLVNLLERQLRASGVTVHDDAVAKQESGDEPRPARLMVVSERWGDLPLAIDGQGRAQEFRLRYAAIFKVLRADGRELVEQQVIELSRDYVAPPTDATGTVTEREILAEEMRREMSAAILRRIDGVVRQRAARGELGDAVSPADADPAGGR